MQCMLMYAVYVAYAIHQLYDLHGCMHASISCIECIHAMSCNVVQISVMNCSAGNVHDVYLARQMPMKRFGKQRSGGRR